MSGKLRQMFGAQDMTVGRPLANLAAFSIPLLIGNLAQQMYNTVDSIIVAVTWATTRWRRSARRIRF